MHLSQMPQKDEKDHEENINTANTPITTSSRYYDMIPWHQSHQRRKRQENADSGILLNPFAPWVMQNSGGPSLKMKWIVCNGSTKSFLQVCEKGECVAMHKPDAGACLKNRDRLSWYKDWNNWDDNVVRWFHLYNRLAYDSGRTILYWNGPEKL